VNKTSKPPHKDKPNHRGASRQFVARSFAAAFNGNSINGG
jgi:hypothetical protein